MDFQANKKKDEEILEIWLFTFQVNKKKDGEIYLMLKLLYDKK